MNFKKIAALLLALCMMLSLCACGGTEQEEPTQAPTEETTEATKAPTEETTEPAQEGTVYKITVVDEGGNPIPGAMVQICLDTCFPGVTNEAGVAEFAVEEADYKVSFLALPTGYTYSTEEQEFYFDAGSTEMTITLKAEA